MKTLEQTAPTSSDLPVYLNLSMVTMIWGGTFVAGRMLSSTLEPLLAASLRFSLASIALLLFLCLARVALVRPTLKQALQLAVLGFFGILFYNLCFFQGLQYVQASRASLIVALNPAVIGLASWWLFKERLGPSKVWGIVLCIGGAGLVIVSRDPSSLQSAAQGWMGDLLIFGCVLGWGIYSLFSRNLNDSLGPLQTVTWSILLGTGMLWLACVAGGEARLEPLRGLEMRQWLSLLYLGVLGSALAYIAWYEGIRRIGATRCGVFIALNPLTAVLLGALLLDERLGALMGVGAGLILTGIFLCNKPLARSAQKTI
ncbi:Permease of the drug/metabolite transporter (DMT) superfamily [Pseudomonas sp. NFACC09-4]|uniref:DMT family transporter n=1 Tax=Pseudomonas TaxID=286 RepID=UPI0009089CC6|nr:MULTISPECIES: DMT family transporter [Pseudomonas]NHN67736.1 DMT family transporter [Pseudomonas fluorescens]ROO34544.1 multidrug transporter [Pseudomonas sp. 7SR1]ROO37175.1 multidrug transporter [Pseudomonas sp. AF76]SFW89745.1 Permease of the drug/metabolite transporter (DMT) superfamily [Pseudomonas sp. NFACC09-4]SFY32127.1 Permease of the drug/metabolite transporter (DMT) superfamily [Pseudomonas sp. NFACC49-2]